MTTQPPSTPTPPPPGWQPQHSPPPPPYYTPPAPTDGLAIALLILGITWVCWLGSVLAVVFGHLALRRIRQSGARGRGMALAGLILGYIGVAALAVFLIVMVAAGSSTPTSGGPAPAAPTAPPGPSSAAPADCHQQVADWLGSPGGKAEQSVPALMKQTQADLGAEDNSAVVSDFQQYGTTAVTMQGNPPPRCLDSGGYYTQLITQMQRIASDAAGVASQDTSALIDADTAVKEMGTVYSDLTTEVNSFPQ